MNEPILGKEEPHGNDYTPITWDIFIKLRNCAQKVANQCRYPVYLVGSALHKEIPRDIDISIIVPLKEYEKQYGKLPEEQKYYGQYLYKSFHENAKYFIEFLDAVDWKYHIDFKVCADTWFIEKDKMLLAEPKDIIAANKNKGDKMRNNTMNNIMDIIKKYIKPQFHEKLSYNASKDVIKVSADFGILFIVLDENNIITNIDICYRNCIFKKCCNTKDDLFDLKDELHSTFIGKCIN